jgi:phosphoserine phosphatase
MTAVYLLRHPQTTWNVAGRYQGRLESPLSDEGKRQAEAVASVFTPNSLDAVYSSPLQRALYLARILSARSSAPLVVDERLTEIAQGPWEGLYLSEIQQCFHRLYDEWYARPDCVRFPGGERLTDVEKRASSALGTMQKSYPGGRVVAVTHSVVIQTVAAASLGLDLRNLHRIRVGNASITTICGDLPPGSLLTLNDTAALFDTPIGAAASAGCAEGTHRRQTT